MLSRLALLFSLAITCLTSPVFADEAAPDFSLPTFPDDAKIPHYLNTWEAWWKFIEVNNKLDIIKKRRLANWYYKHLSGLPVEFQKEDIRILYDALARMICRFENIIEHSP